MTIARHRLIRSTGTYGSINRNIAIDGVIRGASFGKMRPDTLIINLVRYLVCDLLRTTVVIYDRLVQILLTAVIDAFECTHSCIIYIVPEGSGGRLIDWIL